MTDREIVERIAKEEYGCIGIEIGKEQCSLKQDKPAYDPNCILCRRGAGKADAGLNENDLCHDHISAALREAQAEVFFIMKELRGLTPGGSEFQTAKECLNYIQEKCSADWKIIKESKAEVAREQLAHEAIATLCFASGVSTDDGTSLSAVKNLVAEVSRLRGIMEYLHHGEFGPIPEGFWDDARDCYEHAIDLAGGEEPTDDQWYQGWIEMIENAMVRSALKLREGK